MSILGLRTNKNHAPCKECGGPMVKRDRESSTTFWNRPHCSQPCAQRARYNVAERLRALSGRNCACGRPIIHRAGEDLTNFAKRKTCCEPDCIAARKTGTGNPSRPSMRPRPAIEIGDDVMDYGAGFASQNVDPGDGGPIRLLKPLPGGVGSVAGRYL